MKRHERDAARVLRTEGMALTDIARALGVAKSSVSLWVRDIVLTEKQRNKLNANGFSVGAIEKRREKRIANTHAKHRIVIDQGKEKIGTLSPRELLLIGAALYWGEGNKTSKGAAGVSNSDPDLIRVMARFFREVCKVPESKFRGHVHTFSHLNTETAERYWSEVSGIPLTQFYKTYAKPSVAGLGKRNTLPYGTFQMYVCDTKVFLGIQGLLEGLKEQVVRN